MLPCSPTPPNAHQRAPDRTPQRAQEVEAHEVQGLRDELSASRAQLASANGSHAALRQCVLSAAQCLAPEALGAAFSFRPRHMRGFSASSEQHKVRGCAVHGP